jgi:hypothetical protein
MAEPTDRFSDRVDDYARYRPGYPGGVLEILRREVGLTPHWAVADIGSGTGLSTARGIEAGRVPRHPLSAGASRGPTRTLPLAPPPRPPPAAR